MGFKSHSFQDKFYIFESVVTCSVHNIIRDAVLMCAPKLTLVSLVYHPEPATKKWKEEKVKSENGYAHKYQKTVKRIRGVSPGSVHFKCCW